MPINILRLSLSVTFNCGHEPRLAASPSLVSDATPRGGTLVTWSGRGGVRGKGRKALSMVVDTASLQEFAPASRGLEGAKERWGTKPPISRGVVEGR
jgi:hypothetical protein